MELIRAENMTTLRNSGVESRQLLVKGNSCSTRLTITRVTMVAGAVNPRHRHERSEQVWILLCGEATLLLADGQTDVLRAGDVVRFAENDITVCRTVEPRLLSTSPSHRHPSTSRKATPKTGPTR